MKSQLDIALYKKIKNDLIEAQKKRIDQLETELKGMQAINGANLDRIAALEAERDAARAEKDAALRAVAVSGDMLEEDRKELDALQDALIEKVAESMSYHAGLVDVREHSNRLYRALVSIKTWCGSSAGWETFPLGKPSWATEMHAAIHAHDALRAAQPEPEAETFGPGDFSSAEEYLAWCKKNGVAPKPEPEILSVDEIRQRVGDALDNMDL